LKVIRKSCVVFEDDSHVPHNLAGSASWIWCTWRSSACPRAATRIPRPASRIQTTFWLLDHPFSHVSGARRGKQNEFTCQLAPEKYCVCDKLSQCKRERACLRESVQWVNVRCDVSYFLIFFKRKVPQHAKACKIDMLHTIYSIQLCV